MYRKKVGRKGLAAIDLRQKYEAACVVQQELKLAYVIGEEL